jgi:hypothetical protein
MAWKDVGHGEALKCEGNASGAPDNSNAYRIDFTVASSLRSNGDEIIVNIPVPCAPNGSGKPVKP